MVGTCSALHLAQRGFQVLLVDRQAPGRETSYGNAGIIQREAVLPYAFPRDLRKLLGVAFKRGGDVNYHLAALPGLAAPLARYWHHSGPARYPAIAQAYTRLIEHATREHEPLIAAAGAHDLVRRDGYLHLFRDGAALQAAVAEAEALQRSHGLRHAVLDGAALAAAEPALRQRLPGAIHWQDPWSVSDPGELVARYAGHLHALGGRFLQAEATGLQASGSSWVVRTAKGPLEAEHCVLALGPWADGGLLAPLGYRLPLFVKRGYHRHLSGGPAPQRPLYDIARGLVIAPMRQGVRITTGAEFAQRDAADTPWQLARAEAAARELLHLPQAVEPKPWRGARPCTVDMKPIIGPAPRHRGLWFNFGHAHQGFTLGPVSGRLLAELMSGEVPVVDPGPYSALRFL
jgi:D-amino-acid dehydrogenase